MSILEIIAIEILEDVADYPQLLTNAIALESVPTNQFSPRVVSSEEEIVRIIYDPLHVNKNTDELKPNAFDDVLPTKKAHAIGLSINRLEYISIDEVSEIAKTRAIEASITRTPRSYYGYATLNVSKIREEVKEGKLFVVLDTANEDDISHADVHCIANKTVLNLNNKPFKMLIRNRLLELFVTGLTKIA